MEKKSLMSNNSGYYIHGFMRNVLDLKGCELNTFAAIYSFSKDGQGCFYGSREYLADCVGVSTDSIDRALKRLIKKKLIIKNTETTSKGITNYYTANLEMINSKANEGRNAEGVPQNAEGVPQNAEGGSAKCGGGFRKMQNLTIYKKEYIEESKGASASPQPRPRSNVDNSTINGNNNTGFKKPTREEIEQYIKEKQLNVDGAVFYDYYESNGWYVGKTKMKNWKASLNNWSRRESKFGQNCSKQSMAVTYAPVEFNNF